jgi:hypothetical protein
MVFRGTAEGMPCQLTVTGPGSLFPRISNREKGGSA